MSQAYIIEVEGRTAGIIVRDKSGFRFFSSQRVFDSLEGRRFRSTRDAERAAKAVLPSHLFDRPLLAVAL